MDKRVNLSLLHLDSQPSTHHIITHPQHPPACVPSPAAPAAPAPAAPVAWLVERESDLRAARRFFLSVSPSSGGGAYGRTERCTIVGGCVEVGEDDVTLPLVEGGGEVDTGKPIPADEHDDVSDVCDKIKMCENRTNRYGG